MVKKKVKKVEEVQEIVQQLEPIKEEEVIALLEEIEKAEEKQVLPEGYGINADGSLTIVKDGMLYELPSEVVQLVDKVFHKSLRTGQWYKL